ncbi:MAG: hypothetical protein QXI95_02440 [Candidatus Micrarchaeaceae archaeon]
MIADETITSQQLKETDPALWEYLAEVVGDDNFVVVKEIDENKIKYYVGIDREDALSYEPIFEEDIEGV